MVFSSFAKIPLLARIQRKRIKKNFVSMVPDWKGYFIPQNTKIAFDELSEMDRSMNREHTPAFRCEKQVYVFVFEKYLGHREQYLYPLLSLRRQYQKRFFEIPHRWKTPAWSGHCCCILEWASPIAVSGKHPLPLTHLLSNASCILFRVRDGISQQRMLH